MHSFFSLNWESKCGSQDGLIISLLYSASCEYKRWLINFVVGTECTIIGLQQSFLTLHSAFVFKQVKLKKFAFKLSNVASIVL